MNSQDEAAAATSARQAASAGVALDIGHGRGALVIYPEDRYRDREIEISRVDGLGRRVHTGVHNRRTHAGAVLTAIFGSLHAGEYVVWADEGTEPVTVCDGAVTEIALA